MSLTGRAGLYRCAPVLGTGTTDPTDTTGRPLEAGRGARSRTARRGGWRSGRTRHEHRLGRRQRAVHCTGRRRVRAAGARTVASAASLDEALSLLVGTPYGHEVRVDQSLEEAQHGVAATLLWHLRVLGGVGPAAGRRHRALEFADQPVLVVPQPPR